MAYSKWLMPHGRERMADCGWPGGAAWAGLSRPRSGRLFDGPHTDLPSARALSLVTSRPLAPAFQEQGGKGREREGEGMCATVQGHGNCFHNAQVPQAAAAVLDGVAVEQLSPESAARSADEVVEVGHRGEVADCEHEIAC